MFNQIIILSGKLLSFITKKLNLGHGSTWPVHIALLLNKNFIKDVLGRNKMKIVIVAGTNGKTTTSKLLTTILKSKGDRVLHNSSGANLLNGIASILLLNSDRFSNLNYDYGIFEVDENVLPLALQEITPDYLIILNLFRDQLDRYGEVNIIADKWRKAIKKLTEKTNLILNADDPQVAFLGKIVKIKTDYFSCSDVSIHGNAKLTEHAVDSAYCPNCGSKLNYKSITFSHLGDWYCKKCDLKRPIKSFSASPHYPLPGLYNKYNTNATVLFTQIENIHQDIVKKALLNFKPAFGRQETLIINGKKIKIFLSKNPTGFNESLRTVKDLGGKNILFVLNDRIPDGRDVSWIWDTDIENILEGNENIIVSGDRVYDIALRIKYGVQNQKSKIKNQKYNSKFKIIENLKDAVSESLELLDKNEALYIIPTYSAMLEVRKILTGKKIL